MNMIRAAIVDDNDELRNAMIQYLQTQKDISIVGEAANGQDALKMIQEKQPDVVLLDMIMPALDGFGVLNQLQRTALEKRPRVIGLDRLRAVHVNDSKNPLGARKDRHEKIGEGFIGTEAILRLMRHPALRDLPFNLETPNELDGYEREIRMLKELY